MQSLERLGQQFPVGGLTIVMKFSSVLLPNTQRLRLAALIIFLSVFVMYARAGGIYGNHIPVHLSSVTQVGGNSSSFGGVTITATIPTGGPNDPGYTSWSSPVPQYDPTGVATAKHNFGLLRIIPFQTYTVTIDAQYLLAGSLILAVPDGYKASMVDISTSLGYEGTFTYSNPNQELTSHYTVELSVVPDAAKSDFSAPVGVCSSLVPGKLEWRVSLGTTYDGETAGQLVISDPGEGSAWWFGQLIPRLVGRGLDMTVNGTLDGTDYYYTPQARVEMTVHDINTGKFDLAFYKREQISGSGMTGEPFVIYHFDRGSTPTSLVITQETRNITSPTSTGNAVKRRTTSIERSGTAPAYRWKVVDWKDEGSSETVEHIIQGSGTEAERKLAAESKYTEVAAALASQETFTQYSWGEALTKKQAGSSGGPSMSYEYYQDASDLAHYGRLKSQVGNDGSWECYTYRGSANDPGSEAGVLWEKFRPWKNSPATPGTDKNKGEYNQYWFASDAGGAWTRPTLIERKIEGKLVASTKIVYAAAGTLPGSQGLQVIKATRTDYSNSEDSLVTVTHFFSEAYTNAFFRKKIHSVLHPNGTKTSYAYQYGTWNGSTFTPASNGGFGGLTPPKGSRLSMIKGSASSGVKYTAFADYDISDVFLVNGKSTLESTIRDAQARKVREESYIWSAGAWHLVGFKNYDYNFVGQLISETNSDGSKVQYTYDGFSLASKTDIAGVSTSYTYDGLGRLSTTKEAGVDPIEELSIKFEYNAAGNVTKEHRGWGGSETLVTAKSYDDAGRLTSETPPGTSASVHTYDVASRKRTMTRPDASTIIETTNYDGSPASVTGTGTANVSYSETIDAKGYRVAKEQTGSRWKEVTRDWLGRIVTSRHSAVGGEVAKEENFYHSSSEAGAGLLYKTERTAAPTQRYEYDAMGDLIRSGSDYANDGLTIASADRLTDYVSLFEAQSDAWWKVDETWVYPVTNSDTRVRLSSTRVRLTGFPANVIAETRSVDQEGNVTIQTTDVDRSTHTVTRTTGRSGYAQDETETIKCGLTVEKISHDGISTGFAYDELRRLTQTTDGRGNTTTTKYHLGSNYQSEVLDGLNQRVSSSGYDTSGRLAWSGDALNNYTYFVYTSRGNLWRQWGGGTHPVEYEYDSTYGDRVRMKTYRAGTSWANAVWPGGTADSTTWAYDASSGLLLSKTDAAGKATTYTYNLRGQPTSVTQTKSSGNVIKSYSYFEETGELKTVSYNDATPAVSFYQGDAASPSSYTRLGQISAITDGTGTRQFGYNTTKPWRLDSEILSAQWSGRVITHKYEATGVVGRGTGFTLGTVAAPDADLAAVHGYSDTGLLTSIAATSAAGTTPFTYTYLSNTRLIDAASVGTEFRWKRGYEEKRNLLASVEFHVAGVAQVGFSYSSNANGQRLSAKQYGPIYADYGGSIFQRFTYTGNGALATAIGYAGEDPAAPSAAKILPSRTYQYSYDPIGNRKASNNTAATELANDYTATAVNAYSARENNTLSVSGTAAPAAKVVVEMASRLAARQGSFWADEIAVGNEASPWRGNVKVFASSGAGTGLRSETRRAEIPGASQAFSYDEYGNLTNDQIWNYTWDAENRLIRVETSIVARNAGYDHRILDFRYDYMGRRVEKRVRNGANQQELSLRRFIYSGWDLVAEYTVAANALGQLQRSYSWGLDPSGSLTLTGGAGALLQMTDHSSGKRYLPAYDGNGNVIALFNRSGGTAAAVYEYTSFGEPLREEIFDTAVTNQPYRFATKFSDVETGMLNYGRRYYAPSLGRFISRDPIEEKGGLNLYDYCGGDPVNCVDVLGEDPSKEDVVTSDPYVVHGTPVPPDDRLSTREEHDYMFHPHQALGSLAGTGHQASSYSNPFRIGTMFPRFSVKYAAKLHYGVQKLSNGPDPKSPALVDAPNSEEVSDAMIASILEASPLLASKGSMRGVNTSGANLAAAELAMLRRIGAERDPVRRERLQNDLASFRWANGIRAPAMPRDLEFRAPGRSGAFREAKRDLEIPRSQQPNGVRHVPMTDMNGNWVIGPNGRPITTREYTFVRPDGSRVIIQDHSAGHVYQNGVGTVGPHFNVRPIEQPRNGSVEGTQPHYEFFTR